MARTHARVYLSIWADPDFTTLTESAQRMFLFLASQPDIEHSGVLGLRERRWTRCAADSTLSSIEKALAELIACRFIVVDEDTEEVLVRSFMRWDNVWKQPNTAKSAAANIRTLTSVPIRAALLGELRRIEVDGSRMQSHVYNEVRGLHDALVYELGDGTEDGASNPSGNPSPMGTGMGSANPSAKGSGVGGNGSSTGKPPSPTPATAPTPSVDGAASSAVSTTTKRGTRIPADFDVTPEMVAWARGKCPQVDGRRETEKFINYWRAKAGKDATKLDWVATWQNWMLNAAERSPAAAQHRSTTDERVAAAQALKHTPPQLGAQPPAMIQGSLT